jgi:hypothetical protein
MNKTAELAEVSAPQSVPDFIKLAKLAAGQGAGHVFHAVFHSTRVVRKQDVEYSNATGRIHFIAACC